MAIVLDHQVYTAPVINSRIDDSGVIEGNFSQDSAQDLALVLRAGALPASIKYLEERTVGPRSAPIRFARACGPPSAA